MRIEQQYFGIDWQYYKGDLPTATGCCAENNIKGWSYVNIPHCTRYITPDKFHAYEGISWYKKTFVPTENFRNKRVFLQFDAIMQSATVYLNGKELKHHVGGYMGFVVELTEFLIFGKENVIAIRSDSDGSPDFAPTANKGIDFQYHGGIYRPVHLYATDEVYITNELLEDEVAGGGIFVTNRQVDFFEKKAELSLQVHVRNAGNKPFAGKVYAEITGKQKGQPLPELLSIAVAQAPISLEPNSAGYVRLQVSLVDVKFWSLENPYLYNIAVKLYDDTEERDEVSLRYGIRTIEWKKEGLFLNGRKQNSLHGVNYHQDIFGLGNAMTKEAIYRDVKLIKEAGIRFVRCSHYPHSPYFYDACDEMGLVCLNSITGWQVYVDSERFKFNTLFELRQLIRRDRNHPCVAAWESSINEAGFTHEWGQAAHDAAHEEYPGNSCYTAAWRNGGDGAYPDIYLCAAQHGSKVNAAKTKKPVIISEYGDWNFGGTKSSSRQERGDGDAAMLLHCNNLEESFADNERQMQAGEVAADAYWDFTDYSPFSSEPTVIKCGLVDMYRIPKHGYYFYKSQDKDVMVYIANSWTEASPADVRVYSNCNEVELFLNGVSVGKKTSAESNHTDNPRQESGLVYSDRRDYSYETIKHPPFFFKLDRFEAGELKAVGYIGGKKAAEYVVKTPKKAVAIRFTTADKRALQGNGLDATLVYAELIDENTTIVPENNVELSITVEGSAMLVGPDKIITVGGIAPFWVRASREGTGSAHISVKALERAVSGELQINVKKLDLPKEPDDFSWWENVEREGMVVVDIAREKPAFASSCTNDCNAECGNSGNPGLWWKAAKNVAGEWWMVDTGALHQLNSVNIVWPKEHAYQYIIESSRDAFAEEPEWTLLMSRADNVIPSINTNDEINNVGRYVRITLTGNVDDNNPVSFNMFSVYGTVLDRRR